MSYNINRYGRESFTKFKEGNFTIPVKIHSSHYIVKFFFDRSMSNFDEESSDGSIVEVLVVCFVDCLEAVTKTESRQILEVLFLLFEFQ